MDIAGRLERVELVENRKLQWEQMLGAFWEHMPPVDPSLIRERMLFIKNKFALSKTGRGRFSKSSNRSLCGLSPSVTVGHIKK